jgi:flagellar biogenesis protein FliO
VLVAAACATKQGRGQMFETLFGVETPLAVRFSFALFIMLGLIGTAAWAVRRFATARLGSDDSRGRAPRLAVIDTASVDERRRLILIRRDSVEHLLMIGGPIDIVVEPNIVRTIAAPREVAVTRLPAAAEPHPHTIPELDKRSLPQQPEAAATPRLAPRTEPLPEAPAARPPESHAELFIRPQHDTLAALAAELLTRRVQRGGLPGNDRAHLSKPRMPVELTPVNSASVNPNLAKLAHHLEAALRVPDMPAERREAYAPAMPASAASRAVEHAAAALRRTRARAARMAEPKSMHTEADPREGAALYDSDNLAPRIAHLLGRRIS